MVNHLQSGFIKQNDFAIEVGSKEWKKVSDFVILLEECIEDKKVESVKLDSNIVGHDKNKNNSITKVSFELLKENTIKYILFLKKLLIIFLVNKTIRKILPILILLIVLYFFGDSLLHYFWGY